MRTSTSPECVDGDLTGLGGMMFVDETQDFGWMLGGGNGLFAGSGFDQGLVAFGDMALMPELMLPEKEDFLTIRTPDVHFAALSRLNVRLNATSNVFDKASANGIALDGLVLGMCVDEGAMVTNLGRHGLKILLEATQDFLKTIRAIHRKVGINVQPCTSVDPFEHPYQAVDMYKIDSPTAFLIISCFT